MSHTQNHNPPSFLLKLQQILSTIQYSHIIRWDKAGECVSIVCVQELEDEVLPHFFRHARYTSFVRQLNMYGFCKRKADKNVAAAFYNPHFSMACIDYSCMTKKGKKQIKKGQQDTTDSKPELQNFNHLIQPEISTQSSQNSIKFSATNSQANQPQNKLKILPEINQLIAQLSERMQSLLYQPIDYYNCHELQQLIRQPKFQRVNYALIGIMNWEQISPFAEIQFGHVKSDRMEFIL